MDAAAITTILNFALLAAVMCNFIAWRAQDKVCKQFENLCRKITVQNAELLGANSFLRGENKGLTLRVKELESNSKTTQSGQPDLHTVS